jgi:hypothetical protein
VTATPAVKLRVEGLGEMCFRVSGGSRPHEVNLTDAAAPLCDCEDHRYRQRQCKHIRAVTADPQGPMLDAMTADDVLEMLGPNWEKISVAERIRPDTRSARAPRGAPEPRTPLRRRWWEAA